MNEWIEKARGGDASAMDYQIDQYRKIGNEKEAAYWQAYRDAADSAIASMNRLSEIAETAEAKCRSLCSALRLGSAKGNVSMVVMMIRFPSVMALERSPECSAHSTVFATCMNCLIVSRICLSRMRRSVTTITESIIGCPSFIRPIS